MRICIRFAAAFAVMMLPVASTGGFAHAGVVLSVEAAGLQSSTVPGVITETFNSSANGQYSSLDTAVGELSSAGRFSIVNADAYGGAGGTGKYFAFGAESASSSPVTLTFSGPQSYFGMWWSAADANNTVQFYSGGTLLATYNTSNVFDGLGHSYYGNPNGGADSGEPFAYTNFSGDAGTTFTSVVFSNNNSTGTGFEADNFSIAGVPEPSSLVLGGMAATVCALAGLWRRLWAGSVPAPSIA